MSIKSARSKLGIWNFLFLKKKKKVRVELWNFVETIFREGTKEKVVLTTNKNRSNERKTLRAHYSEMVGCRQKQSFASFSLRSNLNFKKKSFLYAYAIVIKSTFSDKTADKQLINSCFQKKQKILQKLELMTIPTLYWTLFFDQLVWMEKMKLSRPFFIMIQNVV